jgi:hypothetical protein
VARADDAIHCRRIEDSVPALEQIDARVRLRFIDSGLAREAFKARAWAWSWAGIYSALTVAELIQAGIAAPDDKVNHWIGAGASFVGVAVLAILPLKVMHDQRWLERRLRHARADEDPCALLADAERLLIRDAGSEAFGAGPLVHAGNFAFNIGLTLLLGVGFNHWDAAFITGVTGVAVGEIQIISQPKGAIRLLRNYRLGRLTPNAPAAPSWKLVPTATRDGYGLSFALNF